MFYKQVHQNSYTPKVKHVFLATILKACGRASSLLQKIRGTEIHA